MRLIIIGGALLLAAVHGVAEADEKCQSEQQAVAAVAQRYKPDFDELERRGKELGKETPEGPETKVGIDFDVKMVEKKLIFDVPSVTMRDQRMVFGVPQVTMKEQTAIFHTPSTRMVAKKIGQYPEIHGWTVKWSDIITHVPETFMQEQRIVWHVPEFKWDDTTIVLSVPEFRMERVEWILHLPEFKVKNVNVEVDRMNDEAKSLDERAHELKQAQARDIAVATSNVYGCVRSQLVAEAEKGRKAFDGAIAQLSGSIADIRAKGIDPASIDVSGKKVNLVAQLDDTVKKQKDFVASMDQTLAKLDADEKAAVAKILKA